MVASPLARRPPSPFREIAWAGDIARVVVSVRRVRGDILGETTPRCSSKTEYVFGRGVEHVAVLKVELFVAWR